MGAPHGNKNASGPHQRNRLRAVSRAGKGTLYHRLSNKVRWSRYGKQIKTIAEGMGNTPIPMATIQGLYKVNFGRRMGTKLRKYR